MLKCLHIEPPLKSLGLLSAHQSPFLVHALWSYPGRVLTRVPIPDAELTAVMGYHISLVLLVQGHWGLKSRAVHISHFPENAIRTKGSFSIHITTAPSHPQPTSSPFPHPLFRAYLCILFSFCTAESPGKWEKGRCRVQRWNWGYLSQRRSQGQDLSLN